MVKYTTSQMMDVFTPIGKAIAATMYYKYGDCEKWIALDYEPYSITVYTGFDTFNGADLRHFSKLLKEIGVDRNGKIYLVLRKSATKKS